MSFSINALVDKCGTLFKKKQSPLLDQSFKSLTVTIPYCYAAINGATGSISSSSYDPITMTNKGGVIKA